MSCSRGYAAPRIIEAATRAGVPSIVINIVAFAIGVVAFALAGGLAACSDSGAAEGSSDTARDVAGLPDGTPVRVIEDVDHQPVTVPVEPQRVVTLSEPTLDGALTLGVKPVGTVNGRGQSTVPHYIKDLAEGIPRSFTISSNEILEALTEPLNQIVSAVKIGLEQTPPELGADIAERGMMLTGGGALVRDLDRLLMEETGLPVVVAEQPLTCVARGCGMALDKMDKLASIFTSE